MGSGITKKKLVIHTCKCVKLEEVILNQICNSEISKGVIICWLLECTQMNNTVCAVLSHRNILYIYTSPLRNLVCSYSTKSKIAACNCLVFCARIHRGKVCEAGSHFGKLLMSVVSYTSVSCNIISSIYYYRGEMNPLFIISDFIA